MLRTCILLFVLVSAVSSCYYIGGKRVKGNGDIVKDERSVSLFSEVEVQGAIDVHVTQGDLRPVVVEADQNLQQYIEVRHKGNKLEVTTKKGYNLRPSSKIRVHVTAPSFTKLDVSGACNIISENKLSLQNPLELEVSGSGDIKVNVNAPRVAASISGAGDVNMTGETKSFDLAISGAGDAKCYELLSENTNVDISGAGSAQVFASVKLDAQVSGAGSIRYKGNAPQVNQQVSGAGSVKKAD